jgi:hypothetical protein
MKSRNCFKQCTVMTSTPKSQPSGIRLNVSRVWQETVLWARDAFILTLARDRPIVTSVSQMKASPKANHGCVAEG